jgi:hypothetical protein
MKKILNDSLSLKLTEFYHWSFSEIKDTVKVFILLALTIWVAHFWYSASFGLYVDDYSRVFNAMEMSRDELWNYISNLLLKFQGQGRPLHPGLIYLLSFIGGKIGGLNGVYWVGYSIVTINSFLLFTLLKRLTNQQFFAIVGALTFCLFPTDTNQAWLTHSLGIEPSLTFFLIATHCYLSEKKRLSYLFIIASLLCYETLFPLFIVAPLFLNLKKKWDVRVKWELLKHTLVLGGILICVLLIRRLVGEGRVAELSLLLSIKRAIIHMIVGPIVNVTTFLLSPIEALIGLDKERLLFENFRRNKNLSCQYFASF